MRILFLAPEPFFQERGTPIAVRLALQVLSERQHDSIDLLTYHEGVPVEIANVRTHRIRVPAWIRNVGPGISFRKLFCDVVFLGTALWMVFKARGRPYSLVHAVEESVFVAWLIRRLSGIPYIYDMDSSIALQLTEKWWLLKPFFFLFEWLEKLAVRDSLAVVPVCDALALIAKRHGSQRTFVLSDVSLLGLGSETSPAVDLRREAGLVESDIILLYIGNLESYQGIDLMLESFAAVSPDFPSAHLVVIGGCSNHIEYYTRCAESLKVSAKVHMLGPKPVASLSGYLKQADILLSPRIRGNNTPMKIYSYLHSGVPILATRLPTHTQVLDETVAKLALPEVGDYASAMAELLRNPGQREFLGKAARTLAESRYTLEQFQKTLNQIYDTVGREIAPP